MCLHCNLCFIYVYFSISFHVKWVYVVVCRNCVWGAGELGK